jgi:hypothetical protein
MKKIKEKFEALKNKIEIYDSLPHSIVELMPSINELEKEIRCPKYVYNIAF